MKAIKHLREKLNESFNKKGIDFYSLKSNNYPEGFIGISGSYDDIEDVIEITLISNKTDDEDFNWDLERGPEFFYNELQVVIEHESVHREQNLRGDNFDTLEFQGDRTYFSHPLELEAYGRSDVYFELELLGKSPTLDLYIKMFGVESFEVSEILRHYRDETGREYDEV